MGARVTQKTRIYLCRFPLTNGKRLLRLVLGSLHALPQLLGSSLLERLLLLGLLDFLINIDDTLEEKMRREVIRDVLSDAADGDVGFRLDDGEGVAALDEDAKSLLSVSQGGGESGSASVEDDCSKTKPCQQRNWLR